MFEIVTTDLKALDSFIGNKTFLMGDKPCNEDASIFGNISQGVYNAKGPLNDFIMSMFFLI